MAMDYSNFIGAQRGMRETALKTDKKDSFITFPPHSGLIWGKNGKKTFCPQGPRSQDNDEKTCLDRFSRLFPIPRLKKGQFKKIKFWYS